MYNDKNLTCADCSQEFVFTASEQDFYSQRGFTEPRRCPSCRASRKAARNSDGGGSASGVQLERWLLQWWLLQWCRQLRRRLRWIRRARSRSPRDVRGHLLVLRQGSPGPVPTDQRQAGLLQRLFPEPARLVPPSDLAGSPAAREPARSPTRVVSRPGSFDSMRCAAGHHFCTTRRPLAWAIRTAFAVALAASHDSGRVSGPNPTRGTDVRRTRSTSLIRCLYGAPAYARPPSIVAPTPLPLDPDDLPIAAAQTAQEQATRGDPAGPPLPVGQPDDAGSARSRNSSLGRCTLRRPGRTDPAPGVLAPAGGDPLRASGRLLRLLRLRWPLRRLVTHRSALLTMIRPATSSSTGTGGDPSQGTTIRGAMVRARTSAWSRVRSRSRGRRTRCRRSGRARRPGPGRTR